MLAASLLPELPGWVAGPASLSRNEAVDFLSRSYRKGRATASVEVTAGPAAAAVVAQVMNFPLDDIADPGAISRTWVLRDRKAHLVRTARGAVYTLGVILRGGPGDLAGSVRLEVRGSYLSEDDAVGLALALDWDAIVAALARGCPIDPASIAAAMQPPDVPPHQLLLWPMVPSLRSMEQLMRLKQRRPPRFAIANHDAIMAAHVMEDTSTGSVIRDHDAQVFAAMPTPMLVITQPNFFPDYLWSGVQLASARMRDALGLGPEAIEYREVDATGSAAAASAADYRMFRVVHQADPVDLARMYGHEPGRDADGRPTIEWLLSVSGPHAAPRRTVWREGFVPPAPLFSDSFGRLIATEALAERVTQAGLTDVMFQDVTSEAALHGLVFRSQSSAC